MAPLLGVIGVSQASAQESAWAREVGALAARRGWIVVCGGLGGVMEGVSRGAREAGGTVLGILPSSDTADANPHVTLPVATGLGDARNAVIANTAGAFLAIGRGLGTLSEIAFALKRGKPVVGLGSCDLEGVEAAPTPAAAIDAVAKRAAWPLQ